MNVDELFARLRSAADEPYIGEPISQLEHALQCAALARAAHADETTVVAALLHDVGHLCAPDDAERMAELGVVDHEAIGARFVRAIGLPESVAWLVAHHVAAKRYLVATRAEYAAKLSDASKATLVIQGGLITAVEIATFEAEPRWKEALRLRAWDEQAKVVGWSGPGLDDYRALVDRLRT